MVEINFRIAPLNRRVIVIGDSFPFRSTFSSGAPADSLHAALVWNTAAGGGGNRYTAVGDMNWLRYLTYQSFDYDGTCNYGFFGQITPTIVARMPAILAADNADTVVLNMSINSYNSTTPNTNVVNDELAAAATAVSLCQAAGRFLVICTPAAAGDSAAGYYLDANQAKARLYIRRQIRELYKNTPGVAVADMEPGYALTSSGDGRAIDGLVSLAGGASPKIHPSPYGSYQRALRLLPIFQARFMTASGLTAMTNTDNYDATYNLSGSRSTNPALDSTGGTVGTGGSGSLANGWSGGNSGDTGHTRTYAKVTGPNTGRPAQQIVFGGTMNSTADITALFKSLSGLTIGDNVRLAIELDGWSGLTNVEAVSAVINANGPTFAPGVADMHSFDTGATVGNEIGNMPPAVGPGLMITPPFALTATTPRIILGVRALNTSAIAGTINVLNMAFIGA
jgi:hypothetical protein